MQAEALRVIVWPKPERPGFIARINVTVARLPRLNPHNPNKSEKVRYSLNLSDAKRSSHTRTREPS